MSARHIHRATICTLLLSAFLISGSSIAQEAKPRERAVLKGHAEPVRSVAFTPDGKILASGSFDTTVMLWDLKTNMARASLRSGEAGQGGDRWINSIAIAPDGKTLASGLRDGAVELWDLGTSTLRVGFPGHSGWVLSVAFSPDGQMLSSTSNDGTVKVWLLDPPRERGILRGHASAIEMAAFSADGAILASASWDGTVKLWEVAGWRELATLAAHKDARSLAFSPDGRTLATGGSDGSVKLWEVESRQEWATLGGHPGTVWSLAFSPDGRTLAVGSGDHVGQGKPGEARLWNVTTAMERSTLQGKGSLIWSLAFSPDGKTLATGADDHDVTIWEIGPAPAREVVELAPDRLETLWADLNGNDVPRARQAIARLVEAPSQVVPFLQEHLRTPAIPDQVERLITELDNDHYAVREAASRKLERMGKEVEPILRGKLAGSLSPEVRVRVEEVLKVLGTGPASTLERMRIMRGVEALERIDTPEARKALESLGKSSEAKAALTRLAKRHAGT